jgi:uncharacterized protein with von Willebrand factor type A (vWA) domain
MPLVSTSDGPVLRFQDELFDRLFSGELEELKGKRKDKLSAAWAEGAHKICEGMGIEKIEARCRRNAAEAALATQWLAELILPDITRPKNSAAQQGQTADAAGGLEHVELEGDENKNPDQEKNDRERVERVAELIKDDERLKKIALLAGRFKRIVLSKQKAKIKHESDEIADIEQGGEISRLLPSELVKFLSPRLRLSVIRDVVERKALQYSMTATEMLGRGPLVLCLDKSGSMMGDKDIWASAIALALLDMAHRHKRTFILLGFDHEVFQKVVVRVGGQLPKDELCVAPRGGTDIYEALDLALYAVEQKKIMHRADIILITDGESDTSRAEEICERAQKMDVSILGIGIGVEPTAVEPWCGEAHVVTDMGGIDDKTAGALFGK